jgi:hypothetical protein
VWGFLGLKQNILLENLIPATFPLPVPETGGNRGVTLGSEDLIWGSVI